MQFGKMTYYPIEPALPPENTVYEGVKESSFTIWKKMILLKFLQKAIEGLVALIELV